MLKEEAEWIKYELDRMLNDGVQLFPLGNVGCSDEKQDSFQPWVNELTSFIDQNGVKMNIDIKDSPNVDLIGDLLDKKFIDQLKNEHFNSVLCANILTNIEDKYKFAHSILEVIPVGGILVVSVSNRYPYVADPVDTLFRPSLSELKTLFPKTDILSSALVESASYAKLLWSKKKTLVITLARLMVPFYKPKTWWNLVKYIPHAFKPVRSSCLILKKN